MRDAIEFIVKLLLFNLLAFWAGVIFGGFMRSPEFGVGIFLFLSVSFKRVVFEPLTDF
jgi:hypothetical protein